IVARAVDRIRRLLGSRLPPLGPRSYRLLLWVSPRVVDVELFPGIRMPIDLDDLTQRHTYWQGSRYEVPTPAVLADLAREGVTHFFDVGANYGFYSYWMLYRCPALEVHMFEPNPAVLALARAAKQRNGLERLHLHGVGLSDGR